MLAGPLSWCCSPCHYVIAFPVPVFDEFVRRRIAVIPSKYRDGMASVRGSVEPVDVFGLRSVGHV